MAIDKTFMVRQIQTREKMYVATCAYTNMPFCVCDPDTGNDQVFIFENEQLLQDFARPYTEKKILLRGLIYQNKDFLKFFSSLFTIGVNELVFIDESGRTALGLEDIVRRPDYSKLKPQQRPLLNPNLQLTGIYFMQEALRPVPNDQKEGLADLEEEFSSNLLRSRYMMALEVEEGPGTIQEKLQNKQYKIPILKDKEGNVFQPLFTDQVEFGKFARGKKFGAIAVPFSQLTKLLAKDAKGYMLNPNGIHVVLMKATLEALPKRFQ